MNSHPRPRALSPPGAGDRGHQAERGRGKGHSHCVAGMPAPSLGLGLQGVGPHSNLELSEHPYCSEGGPPLCSHTCPLLGLFLDSCVPSSRGTALPLEGWPPGAPRWLSCVCPTDGAFPKSSEKKAAPSRGCGRGAVPAFIFFLLPTQCPGRAEGALRATRSAPWHPGEASCFFSKSRPTIHTASADTYGPIKGPRPETTDPEGTW